MNRDDFLNLQLELHEANKQLQQYKSIVKTVDPDNLPDGEDLHFWSPEIEAMVRGRFDSDGDFEEHDQTIHDSSFVTHYIETKDIIKIMGDL